MVLFTKKYFPISVLMITSGSILLTMRNVSEKFVEKNQNTFQASTNCANVYPTFIQHKYIIIQGESLARGGPKLLSMYTVEKRGFVIRKYWQTTSFKAYQTAFRTKFGERRAPSKCCIQKLVKKLETRGSRSNAHRLLSLGPIEGQSVQKHTPQNRTTQRRYTPRDYRRQRRHFGKTIPEFGETH